MPDKGVLGKQPWSASKMELRYCEMDTLQNWVTTDRKVGFGSS